MIDLGKNVVLDGWHGHLNAGDDAFALVIAQQLRTLQKTEQIIQFADTSNVLSQLCRFTVVATPLIKRLHLTRFKWALLRNSASGYIVGGGSLFGRDSISVDHPWWEKALRAVALGISIGPFQSQAHERRIINYLRKFHFIGFRDIESYKWAKACDLQTYYVQSFDLAVLLPAVSRSGSSDKSTNLLGIALTGTSSLHFNGRASSSGKWFDDMATRLLSIVRKHGFRIRCFSLCCDSEYNDADLAERLLRVGALDGEIEFYRHDGDPNKTIAAVAECSHFVSSRLHGAVFSYITNTPLLFISYHQKCFQFAETVGFDPRCLLDIQTFSFDYFELTLNDLLTSTRSFQANMKLTDAKALCANNFAFCT